MLINPIKFIEKHPRRAAAMLPVLLVVYVSYVGSHQPRTPPQEQPQVQTQVGYLDDDGADEPFDRTQCKVYTIGLALGAMVYQFKGTDGKLDYLLFTNDPGVIQTFDRSSFGIFWWSSSGFISSDYPGLAQLLPQEGLKELDSLLESYSYAAIGTSAFAKAVQVSPNAGVLNTCDVD